MGAPDLLQGLRRAGFSLSVSPSGDLAVTPASKLTNEQRATIKVNKANIIHALRNPSPHFDREAYEERAAIIEHDGGSPREQAEALAAKLHGEPLDLDLHCWPYTEAMNTEEINTFTARFHLLIERGVRPTDAEGVADALRRRDREADDRHLCLECLNLRRSAGLWRCAQWVRAGLSVTCVPSDVVNLLQRCSAFDEAAR